MHVQSRGEENPDAIRIKRSRELFYYAKGCLFLFADGKTGNKNLDEKLPGFICEKDRDLKDFLRNKAVTYEQHNKGKTFLIMDFDKMKNEKRAEIFAYYTLAIHSLPIPENASKNLIKKLVGSKSNAKNIPSYLIGQLAKNDLFADKISGKEVLDTALVGIKKAQEFVGGRIVAVDCKPEPKLHNFYISNGFTFLGHNETNNLDQFVLKIT